MAEEVAAIYATLSLDKAGFDAGLAEAQAQMAGLAVSMDAASADITAASAEGAAAFDAAATDISVAADASAADVDVASATMDTSLLTVVGAAGAVAAAFVGDLVTSVGEAMGASASAVVTGAGAMVGGLAAIAAGAVGVATTVTGLLLPALIAAAVALGVLGAAAVVMFAPFIAGVAIFGALFGYFDILKAKAGSTGSVFKNWALGVLRYMGSIATAVSKPVFQILTTELKALNQYVHTAGFHQDMQQWALDMVGLIKTGANVVRWFMANWPEIHRVAADIVDGFVDVGREIITLYGVFSRYWPKIESAVKTVYDWLKANVWPGLSTALRDIWSDVALLAHGFDQAWPQIKAATLAGWTAIRPMLGALVGALQLIQDAIHWLAANSGPAIALFANAMRLQFEGLAAVVNSVADAIQNVVSLARSAASIISGGGVPHGSHHSAASGGAHATGGVINPGQWGITGERGVELVKAGSSPVTVTPAGRFGGSGGGHTIVLQYQGYGSQADARRFARWLAPELARIPTITTRTTR